MNFIHASQIFSQRRMSQSDLPTRLARKWCAYCHGDPSRVTDPDHHYHGAIVAAVREALEEAEKAVKDVGGPRDARLTGMVVAAIAVLRE